ncbi:hypothetical protein EYB25_007058 [Talaromyces marneffei]|nr:hypothetical protein EYB25_007058 [Talaromyces marneffei]
MLNELLEGPKSPLLDVQSVHKVLNSIPASLGDLYSHMLNDHSIRASVPQKRQELILRLATHATRPLRLLEIATVLDFLGTQESQITQGNVKHLTRMSCGPLLEILPDETVSVFHHSFTEFLMDGARTDRARTNSIDFPVIDAVETNHFMALVCVRYLLFGGLTTWKLQEVSCIHRDPWKDMQLAQLDFPFIEYAACNWYIHVSRLPEVNGELLELLNTFTKTENPSFQAFVELVMKIGHEPVSVCPLHVCAWGHITSYAKALIQSGHDCNALDGQKMTPLARAVIKGLPDMVAFLLEHGANPNPDVDCNGKIPLHYAAERNDYQVVKLLLEAGGNPLIHRSSKYDPPQCVIGYDPERHKTPLEYACQAGAVESVRAMLSHLTIEDLKLALCCSIMARQLKIIKLFINLPDIKVAENKFTQKCLILAAETKDPQILRLFLDLVDTSDDDSWLNTLLLRFCESLSRISRWGLDSTEDQLTSCLDLILQNGCDVNARGTIGQTALHECVTARAPSLVGKLLECGADVHATDRIGNTPLHLLDPDEQHSKTSRPILHALMNSGAQLDVGNINERGDAPLLAWCKRKSLINKFDVDLLRPYVKDWNISDNEGNTPIHLLVRANVGKETLKKVVELGADPNWRNYEGIYTTVLYAKRRTPFLRTIITHRQSKELSSWLELGPDLHATDYEGNGALHLLCENNRRTESLRMLLDAGVNPNHRNHRGDTLWHTFIRYALQWKSDNLVSTVYLLRRAEVNLAAKNHEGQTLLHCMCGADTLQPSLAPGGKRHIDTKKLLNASNNPIDRLPAVEVNDMIEVEDHQGQRPIHLAAACSEALVGWLIRRGATVTSRTHQGRNLLHIAAEAKASNSIGLILENYKHEQQRKMAVNEADKDGRTPLHIACRAGRLESVILLLEAGADVTLADKERETPLHACAHFNRQHMVFDDNETLRVTEIIQLLLEKDADPVAEDNLHRTPLELAVLMANAEMAVTLADTFPSTPQQPRPSAAQLYLTARNDNVDLLVDKLMKTPSFGTTPDFNHLLLMARNGNDEALRIKLQKTPPYWTIRDFEQLLKLGGYSVLERLNARRAKMTGEYGSNVRCLDAHRRDILISLARWGFVDLFEKIGRMRQNQNSDWINGSLSRPYKPHEDILPFIFTVASRSLPSMELLRIIVETFNADVNVRTYQTRYIPSLGEYSKDTPDRSVLHILAVGEYWWQTEAIQYLLQHGADMAMRDAEGRTPLHVAVTGGYRRLEIARVLLEHGADPNALDLKGVTPLGFAAESPEMVQLLLQHGGKIELGSKPVLFEAITVQAIDTVRVIVESGFDIQEPFKHSLAELDTYEKAKSRHHLGSSAEAVSRAEEQRQGELHLLLGRPLHYAAHRRFNKVAERHKAVAIVELLLAHGADPWLVSGDKTTTIIHDVLHQGGIVEPFLALSHLELEKRDGLGRTLLMAACDGSKKYSTGMGQDFNDPELHLSGSMQKRHSVERLCEMGANISASDKTGKNVAHLLVATGQSLMKEVLPVLVAKFPDLVLQKNQQMETPLHLAAKDHQWDTVRILLDVGADPLTPEPKGNTILHYLARCLRDERYLHPTMGFRRSRGQSLDINTWKETTIWKDFSRLLDQGVDINTRNDNGETPIFEYVRGLACTQSLHSPITDSLVAAGADILVRNHEGESLLHVVAKLPCNAWFGKCQCKGEFAEPFMYLMEQGLDPFQEDTKQRTPVDVAAAYGREGILALFKK